MTAALTLGTRATPLPQSRREDSNPGPKRKHRAGRRLSLTHPFWNHTQRGRKGNWVQLRYPAVVTWRDRLIERITVYSDIAEARAAAERLAESSE